MRHYVEGHFGALYGVAEIIFTIVETFVKPLLKNITVNL
jgi:hypothetical protein